MTHRGHVYVCTECGSQVYNAIEVPAFAICYQCLHVPGWHLDPVLRRMLGPSLPPIERGPAQ